jgi:hypothetical protein
MNSLDLIKFAELRAKLGALPVKLVLAFIATYVLCGKTFSDNPAGYLVIGCLFYTIFSFIWWCVRACGNWLIGIVLGLAVFIFAPMFLESKSASFTANSKLVEFLIMVVFIFGGVLLDISRIIHYICLKKKIQQAEASDNFSEEYTDYDDTTYTDSQSQMPSFFQGCNNLASIKRRYKDLCRVYHPDNGNGSAEVFAQIHNEYELLCSQYEQA